MHIDIFDRRLAGTLPELLGTRVVPLETDRVVAELTIRDDLRTVGSEATPRHKGRGTRVWLAPVTDESGRLLIRKGRTIAKRKSPPWRID